MLIWARMRILCHLVCSPSMYDGFDEDSQIFSCLPGLVSFEADAKPCRAGVIKGHLKHELLLPILRNKGSHTGHLVLLGVRERERVMGGRRGETSRRKREGWEQGEGEEPEVSSLGLNRLQKLN